MAYFDILVRNAFGSVRQLLREISYSAMMSTYLSFLGSASFAASGAPPDENYARELMQLFSIGIFVLHDDGTLVLDGSGEPYETYNAENILSFSRAWTGFTFSPMRGNIERHFGPSSSNYVDPMNLDGATANTIFEEIGASKRDVFPKLNLYGGFLGDSYPLCSELPPRSFLRKGARFSYLGSSALPALQRATTSDGAGRRLVLDPSSALYLELCNAQEAGSSSVCRFSSNVELDANLPCTGHECDIDEAVVVQIRSAGGTVVVHYEFIRPPCVELTFSARPLHRLKKGRTCHPGAADCTTRHTYGCADPQMVVAGVTCCKPTPPLPPPPPILPPMPPCRNVAGAYGRNWDCGDRRGHRVCPMERPCCAKWKMCELNGTTDTRKCAADGLGYYSQYSYAIDACPPWSPSAPPASPPSFPPPPSPTFQCRYDQELVTLERATQRCEAAGKHTCPDSFMFARSDCGYQDKSGELPYFLWTANMCHATQLQVDKDGQATIVQSSSSDPALQLDSDNAFSVNWERGSFPSAAVDNCSSLACAPHGETCVCHLHVETTAVFHDSAVVPSREQVLSRLAIGSAPPDRFDDGTYVRCQTAECGDAQDVEVFTTSMSGGAFDAATIFRVVVNQSRVLHYRNVESVVHIGGSNASGATYRFRNPPVFMNFVRPTARDAAYETEALLDHLAYHRNTGPFLAYRLIQRLVTSNPSPRYMRAAVLAFRTGSYGDVVYSGSYGDLGALVAAILLDREARSATLDADPTYGRLREPLEKLLSLLRSMEFAPHEGREIELDRLAEFIGQQNFRSPTVFNFYKPEYVAVGPVMEASAVAPEAELLIASNLFGALNGMSSLITYGLTSCFDGHGVADSVWFVTPYPGSRRCNQGTRAVRTGSDGQLSFIPASQASATVVAELDLLLTGGRMHPDIRQTIERRHAEQLAVTNSHGEALRAAQELAVYAPEFHATNWNSKQTATRAAASDPGTSLGRPYKAIIYVFLAGGIDSWNVLVPTCDELYAKYEAKRGALTMARPDLLPINVTDQPCGSFGVHSSMPLFSSMYATGEGLFVTNVGTLIEPLTKETYYQARLPPSIFAHNFAQAAAQEVHAEELGYFKNPKGVIARMMSQLTQQSPSGVPAYKAKLYSAGAARVVTGDRRPISLGNTGDVPTLNRQAALQAELTNLTSFVSGSIFAETFSATLEESLRDAVTVKAALNRNTRNSFSNSKLSRQLKSIAKIINAREELGSERDAFSAVSGGWDHHHGPMPRSKVAGLDTSLTELVRELKEVGADGTRAWDGVTIIVASEFGRSIVSNGVGSDHGWGGHAYVMGGAVQGGKILGQYPHDYDHQISPPNRRGRIIPTTSWEAVWNAISQWAGVEDSVMPRVLPGMANFDCDRVGPGGHTNLPGCGLLAREAMFRAE